MKIPLGKGSQKIPAPVAEVVSIVELMYEHGWNERNGGNLSMMVTDEQAREIAPSNTVLRTFSYDFAVPSLANKNFLVTASGSFFRNARKNFDRDFGLIRVASDGKTLQLLWGFENNNRPTSEVATHLLCHAQRLKVNPKHRVIMHAHPSNAIAMTHGLPPDEALFTKLLWRMQTESIVVFPDGVAVLPWMIPGGVAIGKATCEKMREFRVVFWSQHGVFCSGETLDETFGLLEVIEKAAYIYLRTTDRPVQQMITDQQLVELAAHFKVTPRKGVIN